MSSRTGHALDGGHRRPPLPDAIRLVLAPCAPLFSQRVWLPAQLWLLGALLAPGARTVTAARRAMGRRGARHCTTSPRVLNRATGSAHQASRILVGLLVTSLVPPGAALVLGADDPGERRRGRQSTATGGDREAGRSTKQHVIRCAGLPWGVMMRLGPLPWARRGWAVPCLSALGRPADQGMGRRPKPSVDGGRQMRPPGRRWRPGRALVVVVAGGVAAASLALAWVKRQLTMGSRRRWDAALSHRPGPHPPGQRGPNPLQGKRQRRLQEWAERADTPWETGDVDWYGGQRGTLWVFSPTALWHPPGLPPLEMRCVIVGDPEGQLRLHAFLCPDLPVTPGHLLAWGIMRWAAEVPGEEGRAPLGLETQRQGSDQAMARTTPVLLALFALVTLPALRLSQGGQIPVPVTAWSHQAEPTFADGVALVRRPLWRARYVVHSPPGAESIQLPQEALDLLIHGRPLAA